MKNDGPFVCFSCFNLVACQRAAPRTKRASLQPATRSPGMTSDRLTYDLCASGADSLEMFNTMLRWATDYADYDECALRGSVVSMRARGFRTRRDHSDSSCRTIAALADLIVTPSALSARSATQPCSRIRASSRCSVPTLFDSSCVASSIARTMTFLK